jgi:hypothetical protein
MDRLKSHLESGLVEAATPVKRGRPPVHPGGGKEDKPSPVAPLEVAMGERRHPRLPWKLRLEGAHVACPASGSNSKMRGWMCKEFANGFCCNKVVYPELSRISLLRELK